MSTTHLSKRFISRQSISLLKGLPRSAALPYRHNLKCTCDSHALSLPRAFLPSRAVILGSSVVGKCKGAGLAHSRVTRLPHTPLQLLSLVFFCSIFKLLSKLKIRVYSVFYVVYVCFYQKNKKTNL